MDYCRKVSPLEYSKNRDSLLNKLVHVCVGWWVVICVCGWVVVCVWVYVCGGGDQCGVYVGDSYVRVNIFRGRCKC